MAKSMTENAEALLLDASRAYGVPCRREDVQRALSDVEHGPSFAKWAVDHLAPDFLLTKSELELYTALDQSGQVDKLADLHDLAEVQAITENDLRTAVEELKRSTESITRQTEVLRQQQDAVAKLVKKGKESRARHHDLSVSAQRNADKELKELTAEVDGLSTQVSSRISELESQIEGSGTSLEELVSKAFASDDKILNSLDKLAHELDPPDPEETQATERLDNLCTNLVKVTTESIRVKLDTVYLEALTASERSGSVGNTTAQDLEALQEEVESLYSEILPVAQMSVERQHLEPALASINAQSGQSRDRTATAMSYVHQVLDHLLDKIGALASYTETYKSHEAVTLTAIQIAEDTLASPVPAPTIARSSAAIPPSAIAPSPIRPRAKPSDPSQQTSLEQLLHSLALPPSTFSTSSTEPSASPSNIRTASAVLAAQRQKTNQMMHTTQDSFQASARANIHDARQAVQLLRDSLLAESPFGEVKLVDAEIEKSTLVLEQEVEGVRRQLDRLGTELDKGKKSAKRDELLRRWG